MVVAPGDTFVDPCCGVGTVLIEADRVGARALGLDISLSRVAMAQANLRYFGCRATVEQGDARELKGAFDAAVIDLPYGRTTNASDALYTEIVGRVSQCVERLVVVTGENKEYLWAQMGLKVRGAAKIRATNLVRHIYLMWGKR
jgi:tRNA G10  N-methylase Trm11